MTLFDFIVSFAATCMSAFFIYHGYHTDSTFYLVAGIVLTPINLLGTIYAARNL